MPDELSVSEKIREAISAAKSELIKISPELAAKKSKPDSWSKKEILGHLIDSAANNHHRFVRAQFEKEPLVLVPYEQDDWNRTQKYNEIDTKFLVEFWRLYNLHILWIISNFPEEKLGLKCKSIDEREMAETVFLLMKDYVDHMDHHLNQIFQLSI